MQEKEFFVPIPNRMFAFEDEGFTTDDEFIIFYHLSTLVLARDTNVTITSVDVLSALTKLDYNNASRNKERIRKAITGLEYKNYINLDIESCNNLKNNTCLKVTLPKLNDKVYTEEVMSSNWKFFGFTQVTKKQFEKARSGRELKILTYVLWRSFKHDYSKAGTYAITYSEWEKVLGLSHASVVKAIGECRDKGIIIKYRGDYYKTEEGEMRQKPNRYELVEDSAEHPPTATVKDSTIKYHSEEKREHNWFNRNRQLDVNDMHIYLTTNCDNLKGFACKRIRSISSNPFGKKKMDKLSKEARELIKPRSQVTEVSVSGDESLDLLWELEALERPTEYKKKTSKNDISFLLGND